MNGIDRETIGQAGDADAGETVIMLPEFRVQRTPDVVIFRGNDGWGLTGLT